MIPRRHVPILLTAAFLLLAPRAHAAVYVPDIKALYHLEGVVDSSGNGYTLTNNGSLTFATGTLSNAADQGSNNTTKYLSATSTLGIDGGAISLSAWIKPNTFASGANVFVWQGNASSDVEYYLYYNNAGSPQLLFGRDAKYSTSVEIGETITLSTSTWYHVVGTYDGTTMKMYRANVLRATSTASGNGSHSGTDGFQIGAYETGILKSSALVDEVVVANVVLSTSSIADLWNGGAGAEACASVGCGSTSTPYVVSLDQLRPDGTTSLVESTSTSDTAVIFKALLNSSTSNQLKLQVELSTSTAFTNVRTATSSAVSPESYATTTITNLADGAYYWRAKVLDTTTNASSSWTQFGTVDVFDFIIRTQVQYVEISDGTVVALYHLENASDTAGSYHLTNNGSTPFNPGWLGTAADQGSNNTTKYLQYGNDLGISGGPVTLAAWVSANTIGSGSNVFVDQGDTTSQVEYYLYYYQPSGQLLFGRDRKNVAAVEIGETVTLSPGTWYHVVGTYDGTTMKMYRDGLLKATSTASGTGSTGAVNAFNIGAYENGILKSSAKIDEVVVADVALSASKVSELYNDGLGAEVCLITGCSGIGLSSLNQYMSDGTTVLAPGASTTESTVLFKAQLNSSSSNSLQLQVEVRPTGVSFVNTATATSSLVSSTVTASVAFTGANSGYHWQARAVDTNGAVSAWQSFGATATTTDFSLEVGKSVYFDSNDAWGYSASSVVVSSTDPFTLEFWYRTTVTSTASTTLIDTRNTSDNHGYAVFEEYSQGGINFALKCATGSVRLYTNSSLNNIYHGTWHHVAVAKTATTSIAGFTVYLDGEDATGVLTDNTPLAGNCFASSATDSIWFGRNATSSPQGFFTGNLDEVRVWDRPQTASDIALHRLGEISPATSSLRGYWRFNNTSTDLVTGKASLETSGSPSYASSTPFGHFVQGYSSVDDYEIRWDGSTQYSSIWDAAINTWNSSTSGAVLIAPDDIFHVEDLTIRNESSSDVSWAGQWDPNGGFDFIDDLYLNSYYMNTYNTSTKQFVATHELGHALGLDHSYLGNVMNWFVTSQAALGPKDLDDYEFLWGN